MVVRRGTSQGSGTIIASIDGETLVLTAAHVVKADGPVMVELHRYNLGMERQPPTPGVWPRVIKANLAAIDSAADLLNRPHRKNCRVALCRPLLSQR